MEPTNLDDYRTRWLIRELEKSAAERRQRIEKLMQSIPGPCGKCPLDPPCAYGECKDSEEWSRRNRELDDPPATPTPTPTPNT